LGGLARAATVDGVEVAGRTIAVASSAHPTAQTTSSNNRRLHRATIADYIAQPSRTLGDRDADKQMDLALNL